MLGASLPLPKSLLQQAPGLAAFRLSAQVPVLLRPQGL